MTPRIPRPRLSIVVPARNEAETIADLLYDLRTLREYGHEVLLVDGNSSDRTTEIAGPWVDRWITTPAGRATQMNAGAKIANGDILWFVHADTRVPPQAAEQILLACTPTGRKWGRFDVRLSGRHWLLRIVERMMNWRSAITGIATGDQGIFVNAASFASVSGFPDIPLMEDIALSRALSKLSPPARIRSPRLQTSSRRWEENGIISTVFLMWRLRAAYVLGAPMAEIARRYR